MVKLQHFVGIDISKLTFDALLIKEGNPSQGVHNRFENDKLGICQLFKWLRKQNISVSNTLFCMEHTGIYNRNVADGIINQQGNLWVEMSYRIIRSLGVQRGKNDKMDAERIAVFALKNVTDYVPYKTHRKEILQIKQLLNIREQLILTKNQLMCRFPRWSV